MYENILKRLQLSILQNEYLLIFHVEEELEDDDLTIFDLESAILSGKIIQRQKDFQTSEYKYKLNGKTLAGEILEIIVKFSLRGRTIIITSYLL